MVETMFVYVILISSKQGGGLEKHGMTRSFVVMNR